MFQQAGRIFTCTYSKCIFLLTLTLLINTTVFATQYEYNFQPPVPADCTQPNGNGENGNAGYINHLTSKFDSVTNLFSWTANFSPCGDAIPDGFWLVVNSGPNPKGHSGELSIIYFDASDLNDPKMTVYAYNGKNAADSYKDGLKRLAGDQAPDRILSSLVDPSWIHEISASNEPNGTRTLHFKINASRIIHHNPAYPHPTDPWYGIGMDDLIGYWFHPTWFTRADYCSGSDADPVCQNVFSEQSSRGFLKRFNWEKSGWYDKENQNTNEVPVCITTINGVRPSDDANEDPASKDAADRALAAIHNTIESEKEDSKRCTNVEIGDEVEVVFTGTDADHRELKVNYSGVPDGATMTNRQGRPVSNNDYLPVPAHVILNWTPDERDQGSNHRVRVNYNDRAGAGTRCNVNLCVPENRPPVCDLQALNPNPQCGGVETNVFFNGSGSFDPEGHRLAFEWTTTCVDNYGAPELLIARPQLGGALLTLIQPGKGMNVSCEVKLTISDGYLRSSCTAPVNVNGCQLDCAGMPNGTATVDQCGVCNGTNACLDCTGTPFGTQVVDSCGVCGGTNACLDCQGVPNGAAILDECGVCNGNGTSCVSCNQTDITSTQLQLDGGSLAQRNKVFKATKLLMKADNSAQTKAFVKQARERADVLHIDNWTLVWSIPSIQSSCSGTLACATISNVQTIDSYQSKSLELRDLGIEAIKRLRIALKKNNARKKFLKSIKAEYKQALATSATVPATSSQCNF